MGLFCDVQQTGGGCKGWRREGRGDPLCLCWEVLGGVGKEVVGFGGEAGGAGFVYFSRLDRVGEK